MLITFKKNETYEVILAYNEDTDNALTRFQTFRAGDTIDVEEVSEQWDGFGVEVRLADGGLFTVMYEDIYIDCESIEEGE